MITKVLIDIVVEKIWNDPDDKYQVVPIGDIQVTRQDGLKPNDEVRIILLIEKARQ